MSVTPIRPDAWERGILRDKKKRAERLHANTVLVMTEAEDWKGVLAWDLFAEKLLVLRDGPAGPAGPWTDYSSKRATTWLQRSRFELRMGVAGVAEAAEEVARKNAFHPLQDRLNACEKAWDGTARLDVWLTRYLGAEDTPVHREMGLRWMLQAVSRAFAPGCKADNVLILEGAQGARKSSALNELSLGFFRDHLSEIGSKDCLSEIQGSWIIEMAELDAMRKVDASRVKAFLTSRVDSFRSAYGRFVREYPRSCIFAATTNQRTHLSDETGNRRSFTVPCGVIDLDLLRQEVEQLWGEAVRRYRAGELTYTSDKALEQAIADVVLTRVQLDPWHETLEEYLQLRNTTSIVECFLHLGIKTEHRDQRHMNRVSRTLTLLDFHRYRSREGKLLQWRYRRAESRNAGTTGHASSAQDHVTDPSAPSVPSKNTETVNTNVNVIDLDEIHSQTGSTRNTPKSPAEQVLAALARNAQQSTPGPPTSPRVMTQESEQARMAEEREERLRKADVLRADRIEREERAASYKAASETGGASYDAWLKGAR